MVCDQTRCLGRGKAREGMQSRPDLMTLGRADECCPIMIKWCQQRACQKDTAEQNAAEPHPTMINLLSPVHPVGCSQMPITRYNLVPTSAMLAQVCHAHTALHHAALMLR